MSLATNDAECESALKSIVCELVTEICFKLFKETELRRLPCSHCGTHCKSYTIKHGHDIYGQKIDNHDANGELVVCSICKKEVAAARFAPHLEKCMGVGRAAGRKRSRVKPNTTNSNAHSSANANSKSTPTKAGKTSSSSGKGLNSDDILPSSSADDQDAALPSAVIEEMRGSSGKPASGKRSSSGGGGGSRKKKKSESSDGPILHMPTITANGAVSLLGDQFDGNILDEFNI